MAKLGVKRKKRHVDIAQRFQQCSEAPSRISIIRDTHGGIPAGLVKFAARFTHAERMKEKYNQFDVETPKWLKSLHTGRKHQTLHIYTLINGCAWFETLGSLVRGYFVLRTDLF